ncbi:MAG TPA: hypothetical protein VHS06_04065 [Chloroflexota bacterium]|nr:hypothetical protein [Chloroflexota bacterium]
MPLEELTVGHKSPKVYYVHNGPLHLEWLAEGSDGRMYVFPAEPGGWLRRNPYSGPSGDLRCVSPEKAQSIAWLVYGDIDTVTIASQ